MTTTDQEVDAMGIDAKVVVTGMRTIGVPVSGQDRALDFYLGRLGLEKRLDMPLEQLGGDAAHVRLARPGREQTRDRRAPIQIGVSLYPG